MEPRQAALQVLHEASGREVDSRLTCQTPSGVKGPGPRGGMKLARDVRGLSLTRKGHSLRSRGWREEPPDWASDIFGVLPLAKAVRHRLTDDLRQALRRRGWQVFGHSGRVNS